MQSAQIIKLKSYRRRDQMADLEAQTSWDDYEARIERHASENWNIDFVSDAALWDLAHLQDWPDIARHFGLDDHGWDTTAGR